MGTSAALIGLIPRSTSLQSDLAVDGKIYDGSRRRSAAVVPAGLKFVLPICNPDSQRGLSPLNISPHPPSLFSLVAGMNRSAAKAS